MIIHHSVQKHFYMRGEQLSPDEPRNVISPDYMARARALMYNNIYDLRMEHLLKKMQGNGGRL